MKKIIVLSGLILAVALCSCSKKEEATETNPAPSQGEEVVIPEEVSDTIDNGQHEMNTVLSTNTELVSAIQGVNEKAVVEETEEAGLKMLSVKLPVSPKDAAKDFVSQVSKIVKTFNSGEGAAYDYFYFCVNEGEEILMVATFNKTEEGLKVAEVKAIDEKYASSLEKAAASSDVFKK